MKPPAERRRKPRLYHPVLALARGRDGAGRDFRAATVVENLSAGGLYCRLTERLEVGSAVVLTVYLWGLPSAERPALRAVIEGRVSRVEPRADGAAGYGIAFVKKRLLFGAAGKRPPAVAPARDGEQAAFGPAGPSGRGGLAVTIKR